MCIFGNQRLQYVSDMYCNCICFVWELCIDCIGNVTPNSQKTACNVGANIQKLFKMSNIQNIITKRENPKAEKRENTPPRMQINATEQTSGTKKMKKNE